MNKSASKLGSTRLRVDGSKALYAPQPVVIKYNPMDQTFGTPIEVKVTHASKLRKNGYDPTVVAQN